MHFSLVVSQERGEDVNSVGPKLISSTTQVCHAFIPIMKPGSRIVNVSSQSGNLEQFGAKLQARFRDPGNTLSDIEALAQEYEVRLYLPSSSPPRDPHPFAPIHCPPPVSHLRLYPFFPKAGKPDSTNQPDILPHQHRDPARLGPQTVLREQSARNSHDHRARARAQPPIHQRLLPRVGKHRLGEPGGQGAEDAGSVFPCFLLLLPLCRLLLFPFHIDFC